MVPMADLPVNDPARDMTGDGTGEAEPQAARAAAHYYSGPHDRGTMAP